METSHGDRITPHLYRIAWWDVAGPGPVNGDVYAIDCGETVVLLDSGRGGPSYPFLKANLVYWGLWERVSVCLLTHLHKDHVGGASQLQAEGIQVWCGEGAAAYTNDENAWIYFDGNIPHPDRLLQDGEKFSFGNTSFEVLAVPGHTRACVSYFTTVDALRCAFTGDLVMPNGTIGYSGSFDFNADQLLFSLNRVLQHDFDAVLTGHTLKSTQPEGFWLRDGKNHIIQSLQAGIEGKWVDQNKK